MSRFDLRKLEDKKESFRKTWKSLKLYEKLILLGTIVIGIGLITKGCLIICAYINSQ
jgi:hypothetical protein